MTRSPQGLGNGSRRARQAATMPAADHLTPADRYAELFVEVQGRHLFPDSKTFVDCAPRIAPERILAEYRARCAQPGFDLRAFVQQRFALPPELATGYTSEPGQPLARHIDELWTVLTREPETHPARSSLLALPYPYVVPGGRFGELYYWDSFFTGLGLAESGRADLLHAMTDNFAYLIDAYGHVPNGTRSYYLGRSQPPVFVLMVELCERCGGQPALGYLEQLKREHDWWMAGADEVAAGDAHRRVLRLADGTLLNRYWDERDAPREESYAEDVETARCCPDRPPNEVYRDLRAGAESGWDFSSRWLREHEDGRVPTLADIRTTSIVPVDLNALLYRLEATLARYCHASGDLAGAEHYGELAAERRAAVRRLMFDAEAGAYFDLDRESGRRRRALTAATVVPLFAGLAGSDEAHAVARSVERRLLAPGGLSTTEVDCHEQWDRPNGWAPLQWMAIKGFAVYGETALARQIVERWLTTVGTLYEREGKLVEKYALREREGETTAGGGGGEYPLQDGFGWTNGVTRRLLLEAPETHPARHCCSHPLPSPVADLLQAGPRLRVWYSPVPR